MKANTEKCFKEKGGRMSNRMLSVGRLRTLALSLCLVTLLSACTDPDQEAFEKNKTAALNNSDAWAAFIQLEGEASKVEDTEVQEEYHDLGLQLLPRALAQHSVSAMTRLFNYSDGLFDGIDVLKARYIDEYLTVATQSAGVPKDADLLMTAGKLLQEGRWIIRDTHKAVEMYARAWQAGNGQAPKYLFDSFNSLKDPASAYLWELRCIGECNLGDSSTLEDQATDNLTAKQIAWIQEQAHDRSIITLNGLAAREDLK